MAHQANAKLTPARGECPCGNCSLGFGNEQRYSSQTAYSQLSMVIMQEVVMSFDLGNLLQQYLGGQAGAAGTQPENDFDRVAQAAPRASVAQGVTQALRSDQTPPFAQMVSQMFGQSNPNQRAGMLNQLIGSLGPGALAALGGTLGNLFGGDKQAQPHVSPEQAAQVSPEQVQQIAAKAEQENPSIVDRMGDFYAENPTLVKAIGGAALAIALGHIAQNMRRN
jgi:hypothetical protein